MATDRESAILRYGNELFGDLAPDAPSVFRKDYWQGRIMEWSMRDPAFKVEMFRFVDVFPVLQNSEQVARHLQEYFCRPEQDFPAWIQLGLRSVTPGSLVARTAASQIEKNIKSMASTFVAGQDATSALPVLQQLRKQGLGFTVDLLGEATVSEDEATAYVDRYRDLIETLAQGTAGWPHDAVLDADPRGPVPRVNVSIKLSALSSLLDPIDLEGSVAAALDRLAPLMQAAQRHGVFLNLDMEQVALREVTLTVYKRLLTDARFGGYPHVGCVLQTYLRDAESDVADLVAFAKQSGKTVTVRLVKGAYWDYETAHAQQMGWPIPVYQNKWESDAAYERCLDPLVAAWPQVRVAVASHNARSLAAALAAADAHGVPHGALEFQMLYGMAAPMKKSMRARGLRLRDYVPVGELVPGMAYLVRRLLENTANEGFLRARFAEAVPLDVLLAPPGRGATVAPDPVPDTPFANTPLRDFSRRDQREAFAAAVAAARTAPALHWPADINGVPVDSGRVLHSHNPAHPEHVLGSVALTTTAQADEAVVAAWRAFAGWRDAGVAHRADCLERIAAQLTQERDHFAALMVCESGKSWREADADVAEAIDFCRYYAQQARRLQSGPHALGHYPGESNQLVYQPMGVGVAIAPWNFPLAILVGMTVAGLVTGNCMVVKPAEQTSIIAARFHALARRAGVPAGVLQFLPGIGEEVGAHLVDHALTRFVVFTGSREVGLEILRRAAVVHPGQPGPKRVVCEMGGKNAIVVDDDADLDEAVHAVLHAAFGFQGQKCSACSRVITVGTIHAPFVARLVAAVQSLPIGPPDDPAYAYGPVIDPTAVARIQAWIARARQDGRILAEATPVAGVDPQGAWVPFVVVDGLAPDHVINQEEIFGPVLSVLTAPDFEAALDLANATPFALTGAVLSRSPTHLARAREAFRVGNLYLNRGCTGALVFRQPFGGFKHSGTGPKAGGPDYLLTFVEARAITENTMRRGFSPEAETSSSRASR